MTATPSRRMRPAVLAAAAAAVLVLPASTAAAVPAPALRSPAAVHGLLTVHATGLAKARYALFIGLTISHPKGGEAVVCSGAVGLARKVSGRATFSGRLPKFLGCRTNGGPLLGSYTTKPGHYTLVLGVPLGKGTFSGNATFLRRNLLVTP
jgi:hypothetical protein